MKLAYKAVDKSGRVTRDSIEAGSPAEATQKLRQRGLYVTSIGAEAGGGSSAEHHGSRKGRSGKAAKELALWSRQLCVLVRSGTPLAHALGAVEEQISAGTWKDVLAELRRRVEEGAPLSEAMGGRPDLFDDVSRSLVAAGESSGQLGAMLDRLSTLLREQLKVRRKITGSLVYPALLIGVGVVVVNVMLFLVLPRFAGLFEQLNVPLPPTTKFLMGLSSLLRGYWWALLLALAAGGIGTRLYLRSPAGRRVFDAWMVRLPFVGPLVRSLATARIARLLGVMLESRVPLLDSLRLTQHSTGNLMYSEMMGRAVDSATRGEAVSAVFARSPLISPSVSEAVRHGEQNAQIGPILMDMADFLDEENDVIVRTAMSVLEPLILIGLGVVVGFIALSLFIPLFDLTSMAGGH